LPDQISDEKRQTAVEYAAEAAAFAELMLARGVPDAGQYLWYHTVDLGGGVCTPGMHDYRQTVDAFGFPESMAGKSVLDVGSATGFFAFEFERRGGDVVSVELPSLDKLDRFPGQETSRLIRQMGHMIVPHSDDVLSGLKRELSAQELHHMILEGPFRLCAKMRGSKVERRYCTIYELSAKRLGRPSFDIVFLGDILVHTVNPFNALVAAAGMCRETLFVAQEMPGGPDDPAAMAYTGGTDPVNDDINWWLPNQQCFIQLLKKLGFANVRRVGTHEGILRPAGHRFERPIIRADRH
jgi:tRNA (mo5U34)-methyltransferase